MSAPRNECLAERLVAEQYLLASQARECLELAAATGGTPGAIAVERGWVTPEQVERAHAAVAAPGHACPACTPTVTPLDAVRPGAVLGGCRILERIGAGGMAEVYLAEHLALGKKVAVKVIPPLLRADPRTIERFVREARAAAAVEHPNVVAVFDAGQEGGLPFLVMQYVEGSSLGARLERGALPWRDAAGLARDCARALAAAHERGVVHRDVKPDNVLLARDGRALLADFGLARLIQSAATLTGAAIVGTPFYMAPELAEGKPATAASDLYALGVTLFQMLAGQVPFAGETPPAILYQQVHAPAPMTKLPLGAPPPLRELIAQLLAKDPAARPRSARDVADRLEALLRGEPAVARRPARAPVVIAAVGLALGALALAAVIGVAIHLGWPGPKPKPEPPASGDWALVREERLDSPEALARLSLRDWVAEGGAARPRQQGAIPLTVDLEAADFAAEFEVVLPRRMPLMLLLGPPGNNLSIRWWSGGAVEVFLYREREEEKRAGLPIEAQGEWRTLRVESRANGGVAVLVDGSEVVAHPGPLARPPLELSLPGQDPDLRVRALRLYRSRSGGGP